ncbi:MAG: sortase [Hyphomonadaceae bacterium]|nr:sortase [Hyphomonadaceae bacterium]
MTFLDTPLPFRWPALFWIALVAVFAFALLPGGDGIDSITDKGKHFIAFATLAGLAEATRALWKGRTTLVFWMVLAIGIEIAQGLTPTGRDMSITDACASFAGALTGRALVGAEVTTWRRAFIAGSLALAATAAFDMGWRALRGPVARALLAEAFERGGDRPWPGAPAKAYAALSLAGAAPVILVDSVEPRALALAPGLWPDREPGDAGVTIFMGHRNAAFRALGDLDIGEDVRVTTRDGATFDYTVTRREVVRFNDSRLYPDAPGEQLALVTCWPVDATEKSPWRLVVYADRSSFGS